MLLDVRGDAAAGLLLLLLAHLRFLRLSATVRRLASPE